MNASMLPKGEVLTIKEHYVVRASAFGYKEHPCISILDEKQTPFK